MHKKTMCSRPGRMWKRKQMKWCAMKLKNSWVYRNFALIIQKCNTTNAYICVDTLCCLRKCSVLTLRHSFCTWFATGARGSRLKEKICMKFILYIQSYRSTQCRSRWASTANRRDPGNNLRRCSALVQFGTWHHKKCTVVGCRGRTFLGRGSLLSMAM